MAYAAWSVVAGEQPTAAKWNILGTNDASFNDGTGIGTGAIVTAALGTASVTASKLATGAANAAVATGEATSSNSYVDLATTTDTVTVTIGANGLALVAIYALAYNAVNTGQSLYSFAVSGATTQAAADAFACKSISSVGTQSWSNGSTFLLTGLAAGSTTFKMKYKSDGTNASTFTNRRIAVVPL